MANRWSVTSLVALALLGCLFGTEVEAQDSLVEPRMIKMAPVVPQYAGKLQAAPQRQHYAQIPKVQTPSAPIVPQHTAKPVVYPQQQHHAQVPKIQTPIAQMVPQHTAKPQVYAQQQHHAQVPKIQTPIAQMVPQHTAKPQVYAQQQHHAQVPKIQTPIAQMVPQHTAKPQVYAQQQHSAQQNPFGYGDQAAQKQQVSQAPAKKSLQVASPAQSCDVAANLRVPCGIADISAAGCEAIGCCFDGMTCYFGKKVTVQCTKDAQFIVVVAKDATLPNIDLESISLLGEGQGCTHVASNSEFFIYQFPVTACATVVMEEPGVIIYENRMFSSFEVDLGPLGRITRDSSFELLFQCRYIGTSIESLIIEVFPPLQPPLSVAALGPIRVHLHLANGQCNTKGCNEADAAYSSFYADADYPVTKVLREPVYAEVQLLEKTDPNLVLTLGRCWTTSTPNPHTLPQWDILTDGCPYKNDRYMSSLVPVGPSSGLAFPTHYRRFIFKMFAFVDPNSMQPLKEQVYLHCSTAVCTGGLGRNCEPSCFRKRKRDVKAVDQTDAEPKVVASVGPLIMVPAEN